MKNQSYNDIKNNSLDLQKALIHYIFSIEVLYKGVENRYHLNEDTSLYNHLKMLEQILQQTKHLLDNLKSNNEIIQNQEIGHQSREKIKQYDSMLRLIEKEIRYNTVRSDELPSPWKPNK